jgi:hypothetical protein
LEKLQREKRNWSEEKAQFLESQKKGNRERTKEVNDAVKAARSRIRRGAIRQLEDWEKPYSDSGFLGAILKL